MAFDTSTQDLFLETWRQELERTDPRHWDHEAVKSLYATAMRLDESYKTLEATLEQEKEAHKTLKLEHATLRKTNTALRTANSGLNQAVRSMTVSQRQLQAGNKALEVKLKELTGIDSGGGGGGVKASARPLKTETISRVRKQPGSGKGGLKGK